MKIGSKKFPFISKTICPKENSKFNLAQLADSPFFSQKSLHTTELEYLVTNKWYLTS